MKDKLVKTGHKKGYYRLRRFGFGLILTVSFLFVASVPVAIASYSSSLVEMKAAKEAEHEETTEEAEDLSLSYED